MVEWSRDGWRPIAERVRQYADSDGSAVLELDRTQFNEAGEYSVTAVNEWGSCSTTACLVVETREDAEASLGRTAEPLEDMYDIHSIVIDRSSHSVNIFSVSISVGSLGQ